MINVVALASLLAPGASSLRMNISHLRVDAGSVVEWHLEKIEEYEGKLQWLKTLDPLLEAMEQAWQKCVKELDPRSTNVTFKKMQEMISFASRGDPERCKMLWQNNGRLKQSKVRRHQDNLLGFFKAQTDFKKFSGRDSLPDSFGELKKEYEDKKIDWKGAIEQRMPFLKRQGWTEGHVKKWLDDRKANQKPIDEEEEKIEVENSQAHLVEKKELVCEDQKIEPISVETADDVLAKLVEKKKDALEAYEESLKHNASDITMRDLYQKYAAAEKEEREYKAQIGAQEAKRAEVERGAKKAELEKKVAAQEKIIREQNEVVIRLKQERHDAHNELRKITGREKVVAENWSKKPQTQRKALTSIQELEDEIDQQKKKIAEQKVRIHNLDKDTSTLKKTVEMMRDANCQKHRSVNL